MKVLLEVEVSESNPAVRSSLVCCLEAEGNDRTKRWRSEVNSRGVWRAVVERSRTAACRSSAGTQATGMLSLSLLAFNTPRVIVQSLELEYERLESFICLVEVCSRQQHSHSEAQANSQRRAAMQSRGPQGINPFRLSHQLRSRVRPAAGPASVASLSPVNISDSLEFGYSNIG